MRLQRRVQVGPRGQQPSVLLSERCQPAMLIFSLETVMNIWCDRTVMKSVSLCFSVASGVVAVVPLCSPVGCPPISVGSRLTKSSQTRHTHFPLIPMWDANSLAIGLSPWNAKTHGITRASCSVTQSQTSIPSRRASLQALMLG